MAEEHLSHLEQRLLSDSALRDEFRQAPHSVLENNGVQLSDEQRQKLSGLNLGSQSDEQVRSSLGSDGLKAFL